MTMMFAVTSHRLLLIRQLANNAPNTTAKTRHRTISISRHCPDIFASGRHQSLGRCHVNYYPETETACSLVHLQAASFSSSSATEASEVQAAEEYSTTNTSLDDSIEEDAVSKDDATFVLPNNDNDNDVHVVMSNGSIASENSPPPLEILSEDIADTATAITSTTTDSNNDDKYQGIPPENVIRTGKVEWVDSKLMCGVILQDEPYRNIGPLKTDKVFFTFQHIHPNFNIDENIMLEPYFDRNRRIRFQARSSSKKEGVLDGFNLRYVEETGDRDSSRGCDIPLLHWKGAITVIKSAKARMGWNVFDLLTKASVNEDKELANKVENEIKACTKRIEFARSIMANPEKAKRECKAKLGEEMFDMLSNIDKVDNIQRRAKEAYMRCRDDLSVLGLSLESNIQPDEEHEVVQVK